MCVLHFENQIEEKIKSIRFLRTIENGNYNSNNALFQWDLNFKQAIQKNIFNSSCQMIIDRF